MEIDKKIKDKLSLFKEIDKSTVSNKQIIKKSNEKSTINKNHNLFKVSNNEDISEIKKEEECQNQLNKIINKNPLSVYSTIDNMNILRNYIKGGNSKAKEVKEERCRKSKEKQLNFSNNKLQNQKKDKEKEKIKNEIDSEFISQETTKIRSNLRNKDFTNDFGEEKENKNLKNKKKYIDINDFIHVKPNEEKHANASYTKNSQINFFDEISSKITPINKKSNEHGFFSNNDDANNSSTDIRIIKKSTTSVNKEIENFNKKTKYQMQTIQNTLNNSNNNLNSKKNTGNNYFRSNSIGNFCSNNKPLFYVSPIRRFDTSNSNSLIFENDGMTNIIMNKNKNLNIVNLDNLYQGSFNRDFCELYSNNNININQNDLKMYNNNINSNSEKKTNFKNYMKSSNDNFKASNNPINNYNNFASTNQLDQNVPIQGLNKFNRKHEEQKKLIHNKGENFISVKTSNLPSNIRKMINPDYNGNDVISKKSSKIVNIEFEEEIKETLNKTNSEYNEDGEKEKNKENEISNLEGEKKGKTRRSDKLNHDYIILKEKMDKRRNEAHEKICKSASPQISKKAKNIIREGHLFHCRLYPYHKVFKNQMINRSKYANKTRKSYYNKSNDIDTKKIMYYNNQNNKSSFVIENLKRLEGIEDIKTYKIYRTQKCKTYLNDSANQDNYDNNEKPSAMDFNKNCKPKNLNKSLFEKNEYPFEFQENKTKSHKLNLNSNSMKIAKSLEPARLRLIKKKKKKILNDSNNFASMKKSGSKRYFSNNNYNNSLESLNDNNNRNNNILSYDDYFKEKNSTSKSTGFFNSRNIHNTNKNGKRSRSKGRRNLDLYKRGIEKMKKKEAIYTKNKLDEEQSYKKFTFKPTINNN